MTDRTNRQLMTRPEIERMMREYGQESAMALYERRRTSWWRPGRREELRLEAWAANKVASALADVLTGHRKDHIADDGKKVAP